MRHFKLWSNHLIFFVFYSSSISICCHLCTAFTVKPPENTEADASKTTREDVKFKELAGLEDAEGEQYSTSRTFSLIHECDPCPQSIVCVPQIQCPAHVRMAEHEKPQVCDLPGGKLGYCCLTGQNHTAEHEGMERAFMPTFLPVSILEEAQQNFKTLQLDGSNSLPVQPGLPDFLHSMMFHSTPQNDIQSFEVTNSAMEQVVTSQVFTRNEAVPIDDIITNKFQVDFKHTPLAHHCAPQIHCGQPAATYRSFDGSCNNPRPQRSHWGAAGQPMKRLLPPAYEDGVWVPRTHAHDGSQLKSAREISRILAPDANRPHPKYNLLLMQFGQFVAHDIAQSATVRLENGDHIQCCAPNGAGMLPPQQQHFACMPIPIEPEDDFYGLFQQRCLNFVRLSLAPSADCKMSYGKQRSQVTHYLDGSPVYGSSAAKVHQLRSFRGGKLRILDDFGREMLPLTSDNNACERSTLGRACFESGDGRTNQIISLIVIHMLFIREHNRIAGVLAHLNPDWSDELLFQESRRIVIAELQHIVYNEYLPAVVGPEQMKHFRLVPKHHGFANDYDPDRNAAITNEFSGAAFRMGHSSVDGKYHVEQPNEAGEVIDIADVMFNPSRIRKRNFYDDMLRTLFTQPMQEVDRFISQGLSRFMFRGHNAFGLDLAAINIQRGRDHSLRPYNDYLEVTGQRKILSFNQMEAEMGHKLAQVYRSPDDIDLWVGGLLEKPVDQGSVGITFAEIIADQFSRLKHGDRYFYEYHNKINPGAFTKDQLTEIRKASMARLVCDNADHLALNEVPPSAFVRADFPGNRPISCDSPLLRFVDLEAWRT